MKVFVVEECYPYEGGIPKAVFSSDEKARRYIQEFHASSAGYFNIYEADVDATADMRIMSPTPQPEAGLT